MTTSILVCFWFSPVLMNWSEDTAQLHIQLLHCFLQKLVFKRRTPARINYYSNIQSRFSEYQKMSSP